MIIAESGRLSLRRLVAADRHALMQVFGDADVMRYGDGVQTAAWVSRWLDNRLREYETRGYSQWAVIDKSGGGLVGYCGLSFFPDINGRAEVELGYRLARAWWGRGYATAAAAAARDYAFNTLGLSRLIALIDPGNVASIRVAEKLGMHHEGEIMLPGYSHPDRIYAITRPAH